MRVESWRSLMRIGLWSAVLLIVSFQLIPAARASQPESSPQNEPQDAYADVALSPVTLTADFYVSDVMVASGVPSAHIQVAAGVQTRIDARNVRDASPEFGNLYVYEDTSIDVLVQVAQSRAYTLYPRKVYLKGTVELTCNIRDVRAGESVACHPTIDGVPQPDLLPNQEASYFLEPGIHSLLVEVVGANAFQWNPAANNHSVNVVAGSTYSIRSTFNRKGLLTVALNQPGVVGDLYVDGVQVGIQVSTVQVWVAPGTHQVQGRNFTDPAAAGIYRWKDTGSSSYYLGTGQQRTATLRLQKEYLVGFISVLCRINGVQQGDDVRCNAIVDGQGSTLILPGQRGRLTAPPGSHTLSVTLEGASASRWESSYSQPVNVRAGQTVYATATFDQVTTGLPYTGHFSYIGPHLQAIYQYGQQLGNNSNSFAKIGDCEAAFPVFLQDFDAGNYALDAYQYLDVVLNYFAGSFAHVGEAADGGMSSSALLNPIWADPNACNQGESPLACEYRRQRPSVALIMARTLDRNAISNGQYHYELTQIVQYSLSQGVIPVLSTMPYWGPNNPDTNLINNTIRQVAAENNTPLWDFYLTSEQLPNRGVTQDYHIADPAYTRSAFFDTDSLQMAVTRRNLEALEVLHAILTQVIQP